MAGEHGRANYIVAADDGRLFRFSPGGKVEIVRDEKLTPDTPPTETYAYSHIFGIVELADIPCERALSDLGAAVHARSGAADTDSDIPAGYTYLGQFIVHDITYLDVNMANNGRSPALDLDSVLPVKNADAYLHGAAALGPLAIGHTSDGPPLPEDLPRLADDVHPGKPIIADPRNDNFLPLSQCHLLMLKFYNAIARWLGVGWLPELSDQSTAAVREIWVKHFQAAVLFDYLPRIVGADTHQAVMCEGRVIVHPKAFHVAADCRPGKIKDANWLPIEFAAALGRFGHSMIRNGYRPWNRMTATDPVTMAEFIRLSYRNSGDELGSVGRAMPMRWLTDWFELLDFSDTTCAHLGPTPIKANRIDTRLADSLGALPNYLLENPADPGGKFNLATQTLLRGRWCQLASAQDALQKLNRFLGKAGIPVLTRGDLCDVDSKPESHVFSRHPELFEKTPLWFYMLREAEVGGGNNLGRFGGRIVMETLHAAIEASDISILDGTGWQPSLPRAHRDRFTFADLVAFSGNPDPLGTS